MDCLRDLWPFACPRAYYLRLVAALWGGQAPNHVVVLTFTPHPALALAAVEWGAMAHVYVDKASEHCLAHGADLFRAVLLAENLRVGGPAGRVLAFV